MLFIYRLKDGHLKKDMDQSSDPDSKSAFGYRKAKIFLRKEKTKD
jgi:hypothetical protein